MREGDNIICPACGAPTVVKSRLELSADWSRKEKILICAFCNAQLGKAAEEESKSSDAETSSGASRLAALLGADVEKEWNVKLQAEQGDEKVCRNCLHLAVHPFKNVCLLSQQEVDTMDDCDKFELKKRRRQ